MKVYVPTDWSHITIKQFTELHRLATIEQDGIDAMIDIVQIACDLDYATVSKFTFNQLREIYSKLDFLNHLPKADKIGNYSLGDTLYIIQADISKISAGQYIDLKTFVKEDSLKNIHNIMSVLYLPCGKKYNEVPIGEIAEKFYNKMPISIAYPLAVFFCNLLNNSMQDISLYLSNQSTIQTRKAIQEVEELLTK